MAAGTETGAEPDAPARSLRFGWTTGACAAAAARAAAEALFFGGSDFGGRVFPSGVTIALPRGETPTFALAETSHNGSNGKGRATDTIKGNDSAKSNDSAKGNNTIKGRGSGNSDSKGRGSGNSDSKGRDSGNSDSKDNSDSKGRGSGNSDSKGRDSGNSDSKDNSDSKGKARGNGTGTDSIKDMIDSAWCEAAIEKDAGDDPDVTHGALIRARVWRTRTGQPLPSSTEPYKARVEIAAGRIVLLAGDGVGIVSCPGLPVAVGEPAINPAPRALLESVLADFVAQLASDERLVVRFAIDDGEVLAAKTWNGRLGIRHGLSILGTTGVVRPFSCAAWIASIHRGVDVARALKHGHVIASTGATSEATAQGLHDLPDTALLDMGDFVGGTLKYLRQHPIPRLTLAGGFGKLCKFAQGAGDLHFKRSQVSLPDLAERLSELGASDSLCEQIKTQPSAGAVLALLQEADGQTEKQSEKQQCATLTQALTQAIAKSAYDEALRRLEDAPVAVEVLIVARDGKLLASYSEEASL